MSSAPVQRPDGRQTVTMIPGDGVGPELMNSVQDVFTAAGVPVDFEEKFLRWLSFTLRFVSLPLGTCYDITILSPFKHCNGHSLMSV